MKRGEGRGTVRDEEEGNRRLDRGGGKALECRNASRTRCPQCRRFSDLSGSASERSGDLGDPVAPGFARGEACLETEPSRKLATPEFPSTSICLPRLAKWWRGSPPVLARPRFESLLASLGVTLEMPTGTIFTEDEDESWASCALQEWTSWVTVPEKGKHKP